jgi:LmbE family N-acetylglucosaminyl deacetylase
MMNIQPQNVVTPTPGTHKALTFVHFVQDVFSTHPNHRGDTETARIAAASAAISGLFTAKGLASFAVTNNKQLNDAIPLHALLSRIKGFAHFNLALLFALTSKANFREWMAFQKVS